MENTHTYTELMIWGQCHTHTHKGNEFLALLVQPKKDKGYPFIHPTPMQSQSVKCFVVVPKDNYGLKNNTHTFIHAHTHRSWIRNINISNRCLLFFFLHLFSLRDVCLRIFPNWVCFPYITLLQHLSSLRGFFKKNRKKL